MTYKDFLERKEYLQQLIEAGNTGTAGELARKLGISRRTLFYYFNLLKTDSCCVKFCRQRRTYYFCRDDTTDC